MPTNPVSTSVGDLFDRHQAAAYLGCSEKTIRNYVASGVLPAYRVRGGRFLRFKRSDVEGLLVRVPTARIGGE